MLKGAYKLGCDHLGDRTQNLSVGSHYHVLPNSYGFRTQIAHFVHIMETFVPFHSRPPVCVIAGRHEKSAGFSWVVLRELQHSIELIDVVVSDFLCILSICVCLHRCACVQCVCVLRLC